MIAVKDSDFSSQVMKGFSMVDFHSKACAPCRAQGMVIDKMEKKLCEMGIKVFKADVDECRNAATDLSVSALPTVHLFKDGKSIKSFCGLKTQPQVMEFLSDVIAVEACGG